jgi:hypothetical protein
VRGVRSRAVAAEQKVRRVGVACGELDMGGVVRFDLAAWSGCLVYLRRNGRAMRLG